MFTTSLEDILVILLNGILFGSFSMEYFLEVKALFGRVFFLYMITPSTHVNVVGGLNGKGKGTSVLSLSCIIKHGMT